MKLKKYLTTTNVCKLLAFVVGCVAFGMMFLWQVKVVFYPAIGSGSQTTQFDWQSVLIGKDVFEIGVLKTTVYGNYLALVGYILMLLAAIASLATTFIKSKKANLIIVISSIFVFIVGAIFVFLIEIVWTSVNSQIFDYFKQFSAFKFYPSFGPILGGVFALIAAGFLGLSFIFKKSH